MLSTESHPLGSHIDINIVLKLNFFFIKGLIWAFYNLKKKVICDSYLGYYFYLPITSTSRLLLIALVAMLDLLLIYLFIYHFFSIYENKL